MSRLIDADALINLIPAPIYTSPDGQDLVQMSDVMEAIKRAPTIEPERKKGKWIEQDDGWDGVYYECSVCKEAFTLIDGTPSDNLYNYCPNCGAYMKCEPNED